MQRVGGADGTATVDVDITGGSAGSGDFTYAGGTLSFADGIKTEAGDVFKIEAPGFGLPLRNPLTLQEPVTVEVREL